MKKELNRRLRKESINVIERQRSYIYRMLNTCMNEELPSGEDKYTIYYGIGTELSTHSLDVEQAYMELDRCEYLFNYAYTNVGRNFLSRHGYNVDVLGNRSIIGSIFFVGPDNMDMCIVVVENK